ncbi:MAG: hypothetical protein GY782_03305, partial [Gammaproteobacteria bacterium]|nr:hypothetical protein [Gammaproteobacteria bacterium]
MNKKSQQPPPATQVNASADSPLLIKEASPEAIQTAMAAMKNQMLLAHPDISHTLKESDLEVRGEKLSLIQSKQTAML